MKEYKKPEIRFISFELSESISAGCELISNLGEGICAVYCKEPGWEDIVVLVDDCSATPPSGTDTPCYHGPTDDYNVYTS